MYILLSIIDMKTVAPIVFTHSDAIYLLTIDLSEKTLS